MRQGVNGIVRKITVLNSILTEGSLFLSHGTPFIGVIRPTLTTIVLLCEGRTYLFELEAGACVSLPYEMRCIRAMTTRVDYRCGRCGWITEIAKRLAEQPQVECPTCKEPMSAYFGRVHDMAINYGFRPHRYGTKTDREIAQYQFTHL